MPRVSFTNTVYGDNFEEEKQIFFVHKLNHQNRLCTFFSRGFFENFCSLLVGLALSPLQLCLFC